ncbi:hypothetical protein MPSEU_000608300 [Mayamaea pseudoterrestris]|nr:hypothetical protein MPSEU_000608300 [Mayamaea pseudoterrestris]
MMEHDLGSPVSSPESFSLRNNHLFHRRRGSENNTDDNNNTKDPIKKDLFGAVSAASAQSTRRPLFLTKDSNIMDGLPSSHSHSPARKLHRHNTLWGRIASQKNRRFLFIMPRLLVGLAILRFLSHVLLMHARLAGPDAIVTERRALDYYSSTDGMTMPTPISKRKVLIMPSNVNTSLHGQGQASILLTRRPQYSDPDRIQRRQRRTRPRTLSAKQVAQEISYMKEPSMTNYYTNLPKTKLTVSHYDWPKYCKNARLSSSSKVWITNILSSPPGAAFALLIAKQCHVKHIIGIDAMFPNTRKLRMRLLHDKVRILKRSIDEFSLHVPWSGLRKRTKSMEWSGGVMPTHIIHFDTAWEWHVMNHYDPVLSDVMEERNRNIYLRSTSRAVLDDALATVVVMAERQTQPLPRLAHVSSEDGRLNPTTIASAFYDEYFGLSTGHLLLPLGVMVGPLVQSYTSYVTVDDQESLYTDDVMASLFMALQSSARKQQLSFTRPENLSDDHISRRRQASLMWQRRIADPYELDATISDANFSTRALEFVTTYGVSESRFPCASKCRSSSCAPSAFDSIQSISHAATRDCQTVIYLAMFSKEQNDLVEPKGPALTKLCRIAFISGKSVLARHALASHLKLDGPFTDDQMNDWNGKVMWRRWTLIWLPNVDDKALSDADNGLLRIDPGGMFSSKIRRAIYVESQDFASTPDATILSIGKRIDRPTLGPRKVKERRSGIPGISRFHHYPAEPARKSVLFAGEPPSKSLPASMTDYIKRAGNNFYFPPRQLSYYEHVSHLVQNNDLRPEREIRATRYMTYPFQWISMIVVIHDLRLPESRELRCSWFDEYLFWGGNRDAEELSLAFLLGVRRIKGVLGPTIENEDESWNPLVSDSECDVGEQCRVARDKSELFVRIMKRTEKKS